MSEENTNVVVAPKGPIGRFLALPTDSTPKTVFVAVTLCLVASMIVSAAAVALRPLQEVNALKDKQINILQVAGIYEEGADVVESFAAFEPRVLELSTGDFTDQFDPAVFDDRAAANDPATSIALADDPAGIVRQGKFVTVYILRDDAGEIDKLILPVHGYGLWSTLYGFIALEENGNDIFGLQFYDHAETPGLGAEVDNPRWKALWNGQRLSDDEGTLHISVSKSAPAAGDEYHIDALAGATLTTNGVHNLVRFWMGEAGFGPFLQKLKKGEI
ncbi:Na(+)-translocating NADH-quinone reductase subunit C [Sulfitobacter donghicola]|uniref:Na(+)-translocating NADH-quinone reductase subunit C n=1 Tax=Sulfitobacter donghicola DSW-25 = KCTC 12864 = JCM 14565 TaxID=1300350 RepID=A0A073IDP3_9RHOB|nr:Na(+)-translocating NADH-quinone reductase subunit C [Sulfitobacter donghicola]KEJ87864.1 Na(+)-translocating NADH-quinone reductase subunit C [Sulfitobacter donghicola DSW-25 = KCTC 12864 = JCM 14565]KIN59996.1 NADH:ubiquinone oxidoreductase, C subunit [Sulfitobacter donghicola DSW-25 = KCTC 12864 = JCM 14565]